MKLNISDLLDDYREDALVTEETTPLSMDRVEKMTMAAVLPAKKPSAVRRTILKVLVAAAAVSLMAVTAVAEKQEWKTSDWFRPAVTQQLREEEEHAELQGKDIQPTTDDWKKAIAENQLAAIDQQGKTVNQSVTKNGATVTLVALYGDAYTLNLYLRIEAPEGMVLPDGENYMFRQPDSQVIPVTVPAGYKNKNLYFWNPEALPDADPTDNQKDFVLTLKMDGREWPPGDWATWDFSDDVPKTFILRGLYVDTGYEKVGREYKDTYETLFIGPFEFDVTHAHEVKTLEIDVTDCEYSGHVQDGKHPETGEYAFDFTYTVIPERLALSSFSAEVETKYHGTGDYTVLDFQIVMKDGSTQTFGMYDYGGGYIYEETGPGRSSYVVRFDAPIHLEQIDHVLIGSLDHGDTIHKIYP